MIRILLLALGITAIPVKKQCRKSVLPAILNTPVPTSIPLPKAIQTPIPLLAIQTPIPTAIPLPIVTRVIEPAVVVNKMIYQTIQPAIIQHALLSTSIIPTPTPTPSIAMVQQVYKNNPIQNYIPPPVAAMAVQPTTTTTTTTPTPTGTPTPTVTPIISKTFIAPYGFQIHQDMNHSGNILLYHPGPISECPTLCLQLEKCVGYTIRQDQDKGCYVREKCETGELYYESGMITYLGST